MASAPEMDIDGGNRTVELYVRSLAPRAARGHLEDLIEKLDALDARGAIVEYTVHVWGSRIDRSSAAARTEAGRFVADRVEAFSEWATENGLSTASFFEREPVESSITGETYRATTLPTAALAEYVDDDLAFVTPCTDGGTVHTIEDRLEILETHAQPSEERRPIQTQTN